MAARRLELLEALKVEILKEYFVNIQCLIMDVSNFESVENSLTNDLASSVDILINNAGNSIRDGIFNW